ncbi:MAG: DUF2007 domain-containing protein, partial [Bacteroidales bacterium]|nr:DUF2007 domain-containing protein [Bacteroidales bacterium]
FKNMGRKSKSVPVTVFAGKTWETLLLKSLLEDAGIEVFLKDEAIGSLAPWYVGPGGAGAVKVVVSESDFELASQIVAEFERNNKKK